MCFRRHTRYMQCRIYIIRTLAHTAYTQLDNDGVVMPVVGQDTGLVRRILLLYSAYYAGELSRNVLIT